MADRPRRETLDRRCAGFQSLQFSAKRGAEEEQKETQRRELKFSGWLAAVNIAISLGFFSRHVQFLPWLRPHDEHNSPWWTRVLGRAVDGVIRITCFDVYLLTSR